MFGQPADPPPPGAFDPAGAEPGVVAGGVGVVGDDCAHATAAPPAKNPATSATPAIACLSRRFMLCLSARRRMAVHAQPWWRL
jgi:hypothetical protein